MANDESSAESLPQLTPGLAGKTVAIAWRSAARGHGTVERDADVLQALMDLPEVPVLAGIPLSERRKTFNRMLLDELRAAVEAMVEALRSGKTASAYLTGRMRRVISIRGGPGSGHFGHEGRPGEVGGSEPGEGQPGYSLEDQSLWHGTTRAAAERIRREGIRVDRSHDGHVWAATGRSEAEMYGQLRTMRRPWAVVRIDPALVGPVSSASDLNQGKLAWSEDIPPEAILAVEVYGWRGDKEVLLQTIGPLRRRAEADLPKAAFVVIAFDGDDYSIVPMRGNAVERGGPGSGHFGHEGRPGEVGGSQPGDGGGKAEAVGTKAGIVGERFLEGLRSVGLFRGEMTDQPGTAGDAIRIMKDVMGQADTVWPSDPRWIATHAETTLAFALKTQGRSADDEAYVEDQARTIAEEQATEQADEGVKVAMGLIRGEADRIGREVGTYDGLRERLEMSEDEWKGMSEADITNELMVLAYREATDSQQWQRAFGNLGAPDDSALEFDADTDDFEELPGALHDRFQSDAFDSIDLGEIARGIRAEAAEADGSVDESAEMPGDIHLRTMQNEDGTPVAVMLFTVQTTQSGPPSEGVEQVRILAERAGDERFVMLDSLASGEQGQGLGKALAMEAVRYAAENNMGLGGMAVNSALSFYEQLGADVSGKTLDGNPLIYAPADRIREYYGALQEAIQATVEAGIQVQSAIRGVLRRL